MSKIITLSSGQFTLVDDGDYLELNRYKWSAIYDPKTRTYYAVRSLYGLTRGALKMHRVILNAGHGQLVDHINGDTLNNTRGNLRIANHSQNGANRRRNVNNSTGYLGVNKIQSSGHFMARIQVGGVRFNLGTFADLIQAAKARDLAAVFYFGKYAKLNFPDEGALDE